MKRPVILGVGVLALAAVALWRAAPRPSTAPVAHRARTPAQVEAPDALRRYAIEYEAAEAAGASVGPDAGELLRVDGSIRLRGELVVTPAHVDRPRTRLRALRVQSLTRAEVRLAGRALYPDLDAARRDFDRAEVLVETDEDGAPRAIHERESDPVLARRLLRQLALELVVVRRPGDAWEVEERTPRGVALSRYAWQPDGALRRERAAYARVEGVAGDGPRAVGGRWTITYRPDGALESLVGQESLRVGEGPRPPFERTMRVALRRTGADVAVRPMTDLSAFVPLPADRVPVTSDLRAQHLAQRVGDLTPEAMVAALEAAAQADRVPDQDRFFWQATGLLRQRPEAARALVPVFLDARTGRPMRALVLDLLAHAGTAESQRSLVELLDGPAARDASRPWYLQRLGFVARPEPATLRLAERAFDAPDTRAGAAYAVGSLARTLREEGREPESRALHDRLVRALDGDAGASLPHLLAGLGNARRPEDADLLARHVDHPSPEVREAAARALASVGGERAVEALWRLLDDRESRVQALALAGLRAIPLTEARLQDLVVRVREGRLGEGLFIPLVELLRAQAQGHRATVTACLEAMAARDIADPAARAHVYALLDELRRG